MNPVPNADAASPVVHSPPRLALIIPTYEEAGNIHPLLDRLSETLSGLDWEVIFVDDDSNDGTRERIGERAEHDSRIRCIHRIGRKGLSTACLEGILASSAPVVGIMDADLQHDERILPRLYAAVAGEGCDLAVGSRYVEGGGVGAWDPSRHRISRWATRLTRWLTRVDVSDPMSGFFMFRREALAPALRRTSGLGFKLLLDLLLSTEKRLRIAEVPYHFRSRNAGASKLTARVAWQLVLLILDKHVGRYVPARFVSFSLVGAFGVFVHFLVLAVVFRWLGAGFEVGQAMATLTAMTSNFLLNNVSTFADRTLRGKALVRGWLSFVGVCAIGALANVGVARALFQQDVDWALSALAGVIIGAVWNYAVTNTYTWKADK